MLTKRNCYVGSKYQNNVVCTIKISSWSHLGRGVKILNDFQQLHYAFYRYNKYKIFNELIFKNATPHTLQNQRNEFIYTFCN